jgi:hypothetical protein
MPASFRDGNIMQGLCAPAWVQQPHPPHPPDPHPPDSAVLEGHGRGDRESMLGEIHSERLGLLQQFAIDDEAQFVDGNDFVTFPVFVQTKGQHLSSASIGNEDPHRGGLVFFEIGPDLVFALSVISNMFPPEWL